MLAFDDCMNVVEDKSKTWSFYQNEKKKSNGIFVHYVFTFPQIILKLGILKEFVVGHSNF